MISIMHQLREKDQEEQSRRYFQVEERSVLFPVDYDFKEKIFFPHA